MNNTDPTASSVRIVIAALACIAIAGCVGPWSRSTNVPLPSTKFAPSTLPVVTETNGGDDATEAADIVVRGQSPLSPSREPTPGSTDYYRQGMAPSVATPQAPAPRFDPQVQPAQYSPPQSGFGGSPPPTYPSYGTPPPPAGPFPGTTATPQGGVPATPPATGLPQPYPTQPYPAQTYPGVGPIPPDAGGYLGLQPLPDDTADLVVNLREAQTGRFMFGVGVNSDLGLTAQVIVDERNFDWRRLPRSFDDIINGTAFRGGGQALRIEAIPGSEVQRYLVNFTQPFLCDTPISLNLSGFLYDRRFFDWDEQRLGGRVGLGYRLTPDLSLSASMRFENVEITNPRVRGVPQLEEVLGNNELYSGRIALAHDTRDIPFAPTEGHFLELSYEQAFGSFDYPRGGIDYRRYFLISERADRSGRHTLGLGLRAGFSGSQTPIYENYFAGGYSTMRGFRFRHASPKVDDVIVGGQFSLLGTAEYLFPITADDMLKGVFFADYGTVEEEIEINKEDFRVALGFGLRVQVPAMGPAPIALDFAIPIARENTDRIQNFSFFVGFGRN